MRYSDATSDISQWDEACTLSLPSNCPPTRFAPEASAEVKQSNSQPTADDMQAYVQDFTDALGVPIAWSLPGVPEFVDLLIEDMHRRGWSSEVIAGMTPPLPVAAELTTAAYGHLPSMPAKLFVGLFTAFILFLDDGFQDFIPAVKAFNDKFLLNEPQGHCVLDAFIELLREAPTLFGEGSRLILTSAMNYVTSLILENDFPSVTTYETASEYPKLIRRLSGVPEAFGMFIFPSSLPWNTYIHILPYLMDYLNYSNDAYSFYKEELAGEETNVISMLARCEKKPKLEIAKRIRQEAIQCSKMIHTLLQDQPEALGIFNTFEDGYVRFHTACSRYKLEGLFSRAR